MATLDDVARTAWSAYDSAAIPWAWSRIKDPDAPASVVFIAARRILGADFLTWEPETLHLELADMPVVNRDKLLAAIAVATHPAFYWDPRVLGATALAFNGEAVFASEMPHSMPEQLAWAVLEAELVFALEDDGTAEPNFDDEAAAYVAAMLFDAGLAFAPQGLEFAEEHLLGLLSKDGRDLHAKVKAAPRSSKAGSSGEDPALDAQLERWDGISAYVQHQLDKLADALKAD